MDSQVLPMSLSPLSVQGMLILAGIAAKHSISASRQDSVKAMLASMAASGGWKGLYTFRLPGDDQGSEIGPWKLRYPAFEHDLVKSVLT